MQPRLPNNELQESYSLAYDHAELTGPATMRLDKVPAGKTLRIDEVKYINQTGLAGDNTNAFSLELKVGATRIALVFNTDTNDVVAGASVAADTWLSASPVAAAAVLAAGAEMDLVFTEDGTATLPAGRVVVRGRFV
jgi:hypothetical protein